MTMKKKILTTLSVVLILGLAALGILAYLQDEDSDVNVMTLGNVSIKQHEYQRVENADGTYETDTIDNVRSYVLEDFEQGKALLPSAINTTTWEGWDWDNTIVRMTQVDSYGGMQVFKEASNAQDKFVVVENTGKTDAYVRTLVAIEVGDGNAALIGTSYHSTWSSNKVGTVTIDGNNYYVYEYVYAGGQLSDGSWRHGNGILPAGDTAYPNLSQVYIKSEATNEDCEALDGNGNGTLDILVLSQAVQAEGFADAQTALDTAFGKTSEKAAEWFGGMKPPAVISTADEAYNLFSSFDQSGKSGTIVLNGDYNTSDAEKHWSSNREYALRAAGTDVTVDLNGYTINHDTEYQDGKSTGYTYLFTTAYNGKLTINGEGTINSHNKEGCCNIVYAQGPSEVVINGGDFRTNKGVAVWAGNGAKVTINGGSFISSNSASDEELIYSSGGIIDIFGGFFHNEEWENRPVNVADANRGTGFINIYGGTFVNFDPSTGGNDPDNIKVMDGYKVVSETQANGDVWYTVVPE